MMNVPNANFSPSPFGSFPGTQYTHCVNYYTYCIYKIMFYSDLLLIYLYCPSDCELLEILKNFSYVVFVCLSMFRA